jgi:threonine aldolase
MWFWKPINKRKIMIDLRSDTFTKPTPEMLDFMFKAQVGDDVFGEDPTVNELEHKAAQLFGMEAGLFCPSGTMTNQIAIKAHTQPGDELICSRESHIYCYEGGGIAYNAGVSARLIEGESGLITANDVLKNINAVEDYLANTSLVSVENTSNRGGGNCYQFSDLVEMAEVCKSHQLKFHLDGARIFNAIVAKNENPLEYGQLFDSISICLSKGLGAPVGSVLLGNAAFIKKARRIRKVMGGGMRQAGYLAAAGIFALDNNVNRLRIDHDNAKNLAVSALKNKYVDSVIKPETNILMLQINSEISGQEFANKLKEKNIYCLAIGPQKIRIITHLDVSDDQIVSVKKALEEMD